jgi:hypothetical protein
MDEERDHLRDVARAAAAWVKAEADYHALIRPTAEDAANAPWPKAFTDELHRRAVEVAQRHDELVRALSRLTEVAPGLLDPRSGSAG